MLSMSAIDRQGQMELNIGLEITIARKVLPHHQAKGSKAACAIS